jgi:site-specific recombinase XerC
LKRFIPIVLAFSRQFGHIPRMARTPKFTVKKTPAGWMLNLPATVTDSGRRERHFYKSRDLAREASEKLRADFLEHGGNVNAITPTLAADATRAAAILAKWEVTLTEAARIVSAIRERESASCPLTEAADAWLVACGELRPKTVQGYKQTANKLRDALGERILATLTASDLQAVLAPGGCSASSAAGHLRNGKALWMWSAKKGWCKPGVFKGIECPKGEKDSEIEILTVEGAKALLDTAAANYPQAVPYFALQLFAGIRAEEVRKLEAEHVSADGIELPATVTKKGRRRHITPNATLAAWLARFPFEPVANWPRVDRACRRLAGWELAAEMLSNPPPAHRGKWKQNAMRHSHASYSIAAGVPLESLLFEFGHVGTPALLREHYVGRASKKEAVAFFAIRPEGAEAATQFETVEKSA